MNKSLLLYVRFLATAIIFPLSFWATAQTPDASGIVYVTTTGTGNGSSWASATDNLQGAINTTGAQKVFVATGNYNVGSSSFIMKNGVEIYGGFDPDNGIKTLNDARILPNKGMGDGSVLDGKNTRPVIWNDNNGLTNNALLDGFTIRNGYAGNGGGIYNNQVSPVFNNLVVKDNDATSYGGGIYNNYSNAVFTDVIIKDNVANSYGGGIYNDKSATTWNDVTIEGNRSNTSSGGGVYDEGEVDYYENSLYNSTYNRVTIKNNIAAHGGGIYSSNNSSVYTDVIIQDNESDSYGGGFYNNTYSSPVLTNVHITGNKTSYDGGGFYNSNRSKRKYPILTNVLIADNTAGGSGGGYYEFSREAVFTSLTNLTIVNNSPNALHVAGGWIKLTNSIVLGDIIEDDYDDVKLEFQYSLIQNRTDTDNGNIDATNITATNIFNNPSAGDYNLKKKSPAVDAGNNTLFPGLDANTPDLAGNPRVYDYADDGIIDLGVYESTYTRMVKPDANGIIYVREGFTGNGKSWEKATGELQDAINSTGVQKVFVAIGNYNTIDHSFIMKNDVAIYGGFDPDNNIKTLNDARILPNKGTAEGSVLNGQNTRPVIWNVFDANTTMNNTAVLDGFTVTNGKYAGPGAGIRNIYASPTLNNLVVKANETTYTGNGAGIYLDHSSPVISNTQIIGNTSTFQGGGIWSGNYSSPVLTNVQISGNKASYQAGAFYNDVNSTAVLTNVSITDNTVSWTTDASGGIYTSGSLKLTNVTFAGNKDVALYVNDGTPDINNSIIYGRIAGTGSYVARYSLIQNSTDTDNGNLDATNMADTDIFNNPSEGDYSLKKNAPAINAGNNSLFENLKQNTVDLAGNPRVHNFTRGGIIDLGAYESNYNSPLAPDANGIIYVGQEATGTGSGKNWANATNDLHNAIHTTDVQQVFVAIGNYNVGDHSFIMKNDVEIYGGFNPDNNIQTLNDDRILPDKGMGDGSVLNGQNTRAVIYNNNNGLNNTALLDGFTLTNGNGNNGGALYNYNVSPAFNNLLIKNNTATTGGGGIYNVNAPVRINNSVIKNNTALYGGGIRNNGSASVLTNVRIIENSATMATAGAGGGGIFNENSALILTNVLIADNNTNFQGGGFRNLSGNPVFTNVTFANNTADVNYDAMDIQGGIPELNNSIVFGTISGTYNPKSSLIQNNTDLTNGNTDATNITAEAIFTDAANGDYTLLENSPVIDAGNNTLYTGLDANTTDLAGNARLYGATIDLGAYEYQSVITTYMTGTDLNNRVILYPNPAREQVTISGLSGNETIYFYDATGSMMKQVKCNGQQISISLDNLNQGIYHIEIVSDNGNRTVRKLMKP